MTPAGSLGDKGALAMPRSGNDASPRVGGPRPSVPKRGGPQVCGQHARVVGITPQREAPARGGAPAKRSPGPRAGPARGWAMVPANPKLSCGGRALPRLWTLDLDAPAITCRILATFGDTARPHLHQKRSNYRNIRESASCVRWLRRKTCPRSHSVKEPGSMLHRDGSLIEQAQGRVWCLATSERRTKTRL